VPISSSDIFVKKVHQDEILSKHLFTDNNFISGLL
jgi:hypothetical protein